MKKFIIVAILSIGFVGYSQINVPVAPAQTITSENPFMDLSEYSVGAPLGYGINEGKGLVFPSTDLTQWTFNTTFLGTIFPTYFDGMIIYNTGTGATLTGTNNPNGSSAVAPGFYYFSNPNWASNFSIDEGRWIPVGGSSATVKSKTVEVVVPANPTTATLDLGTSVIAASEVTSFLGAKIYDNSGNLVMTADSAYNKATNLLTTGNGIMYQVLPAGTYQVVVDYK